MARKELVVQFSPGEGPFDTPTWVTLSAGGPHGNRARSAEWSWGRERDDQDWPQGEATITLGNHDRLFDPDNTASTYTGQLLPRVPFRLRTDDGEDLFYGFVEDGWEQTYSHPKDGYCTVRLVDMLAVIEGYTLPSVFDVEVLADGPVAYWPLNETSGRAMTDATGTHRDGEYVPGTTALATTKESADGASVTGLDLDADHWGQLRDVSATVHSPPAVLEVVFAPPSAGDAADALKLLFRSGTGNPFEGASLVFDGTVAGIWNVSGTLRDPGGNDGGLSRNYLYDAANSGVHIYAHRRINSGTAAQAWVDGEDVTASNFVVAGTGLAVAPGAVIGASDYLTVGGNVAYPGFIGGVALFDTDIGTTRIAAHAAAVLAPLAGLRSDQQIAWALDRVGVPAGSRSLDVGRSIMGPAITAGQDALDFIRKVARSEQGAFYVDHHDGGKLRFVERYAAWTATRSTVAQATFSDDPANLTAIRVEPGSLVVEANGIRTVINQVTVTWAGGQETAEDSISVAAYGPRGRTLDTLAGNPNQARSLAQWVSRLRADPATRVRGFGINPAAAEAGFPVAVDLRPYDLVTYRSQPAAVGTVVTRSLFIEGGRHQVEGLHWETTFFTSNAPSAQTDLFTLGTSELDGPDILAF